jgi:HPt (histidine-containing phosphotransfer) domain-containing protein
LAGSITIVDDVKPFLIQSTLKSAGWKTRACTLNDLAEWQNMPTEGLVLIIRPDDRSRATSDAIIGDLRRCLPTIHDRPIIALGSWQSETHVDRVTGADLHLDAKADDQELLTTLARYDSTTAPHLEQLVQAFGAAAMVPLVAGLRDLLIEALPTLEQDDRSMAHRIAGSAGILGFAELGAAWSDFEHVGCAPVVVARATRRALLQLTRTVLDLEQL